MTQLISDMSQTWNSPGVTKQGIKLNVTDTASAANSTLLDLQIGGSSKFKVDKAGVLHLNPGALSAVAINGGDTDSGIYWTDSGQTFNMVRNGATLLTVGPSAGPSVQAFGSGFGISDVTLYRDATNILAQRSGVNAQQFRLYNTYTDASNYEYGALRWNSNVLELRTDQAGTGSTRWIGIVSNGTTLALFQGNSSAIQFSANQINYSNATGLHKYGRDHIVGWSSEQYATAGVHDLVMKRSAAGTLLFGNAESPTDFNRIQLGGTTASFPSLKRDAANLRARLADDSADTAIIASSFQATGSVANSSILFSDQYSLTGSNASPAIDISGTWNTTGTPTGLKFNVTDTASNAASLLLDLQVGGSSKFKVDKAGKLVFNNGQAILDAVTTLNYFQVTDTGGTNPCAIRAAHVHCGSATVATIFLNTASQSGVQIDSTRHVGWSPGNPSSVAPDTKLWRDDVGVLAQRNGANAQTFRIYKTYTDASNYERLSFFSDVAGFYVATERAGTGVSRNLCLRAASDYIYSENIHVFNKWSAHTSVASPGASVGGTIRFHANTAASKIRWSMIDPDGVSHVIASQGGSQALIIPVSDESTALTTGAGKMTFRMPYAFKLLGVRASVNTAPVGATLNIDINENGVSVLSTVLSIDAGEKTSTTAATPAVISDADIADDAEITIDIDQVGSSVAGAGLKITLIGSRQ